MSFSKNDHMIKVQGGRQYLPVSARILWVREQHPDWGIVTEAVEINHEKQYAVFRATVFDENGKIMGTGTKKEDVRGFGDYIEKAETGAIGRALGICGYGTDAEPGLIDDGIGAEQSAPPAPAAPGDSEEVTDLGICCACGKPLSAAQSTLSMNRFGRLLCPFHQRGRVDKDGRASV